MLLLPLMVVCATVLSVQARDSVPEIPPEIPGTPENLTLIQKWENFESKVKGIANAAIKLALPRLMEGTGSLNLSSSCMRDSLQLIAGMRKTRPWAIRFVDASAKIIDGILGGSMSAFGAYDQCVDTVAVSERSRDKGREMFRGQYCTVLIKPPLPPKRHFYKLQEVLEELKNFSQRGTAVAEAAKYAQFFHFLSFRLGICVPSGCTIEDIDKLAKILGDVLSLSAHAHRCEVKPELKLSNVMICVMFAFSFAGFFLLIGTLIDLYAYYNEMVFHHKGMKILTAFSMLSNFKKFANTGTSSDTLSCLNGVRFLCMSWIVLGHTYLNVNFQMFRGLESVTAYARDFAFQAIVNASVAVDTFFFMGGLLVCYLTVKLVKQGKQPFNIRMYILHRLWRILPVYAFVIMFMFLGTLLGSGPIWHDTTEHFVQNCHDNWWTNILFINNFYNADKMCIPQSWYIASDFQLYIAALVILLPLLRWPKVGIALTVAGVLASMIYGGVGTYVNDYPPTMLFAHPDPEQRINYWANFYFKPFVHAGPYCIGMLAGYLLATKPNLKIPRVVLVIGWCLAIIFNMSVLYGVWEWNRGVEPTLFENMFYSSCNRVAWSLGVGWMIVCCTLGYGGVVNYILTWKAWVPLGRLTFIVYLIHPIVQIAAIGNIRTELQPSHFLAVWVYFGHLCVTYGCAFAGTMLVEAPFLALEKIIFPKPSKNTEDNSLVNENNSSHLKGSLHADKTGDIAVIVPDGICNGDALRVNDKSFVCRL